MSEICINCGKRPREKRVLFGDERTLWCKECNDGEVEWRKSPEHDLLLKEGKIHE